MTMPTEVFELGYDEEGNLRIKCPRALFEVMQTAISTGTFQSIDDDTRVSINLGSSDYALINVVFGLGPEQPPCLDNQ